MKKSRIGILILLMAVALVGIILVQMYWVNNVLAQKEKLFDYQVSESMNAVAKKMETRFAANMLNKELDLFNTIDSTKSGGIFQDSISFQNIFDDSIVQRIIEAKTKDGITTYSYQETKVSISPFDEAEQLKGSIPNRPTVTLQPLDLSKNMPEDIMAMEDVFAPQIISEIDKQFQVNEETMRRVMEQMMLEMMRMGINPESKIDLDYLYDVLQNELLNRGIDLDFNFGVLVDGKYFMIPEFIDTDKKDLLLTKYKTSLFPSDLFTKPDTLVVDFPHQKNYLFQSVWILVLGSCLFTAIIGSVFTYTIQLLYKQKKMSAIKSDFINNMTHEFKTPLATISLATDAISNPMIIENKEKILHYSNIIREENKRMNGQVEKVLQMALLDKNQMSLSKDEIDLHDIIARAVENISIQIEEKGGEIVTELDAEYFEIIGDEIHLMNVIYNLLDNANKYSPECPHITVTTSNNQLGIFISVRDKGIGMTQESVKMIFEKFYRVHTGNIHNVKGFGLGLAYVKAILDAHNGTIEVLSTLTQGSTFKIFIPFVHGGNSIKNN